MFTLLLASLLLAPTPPSYSAVVVDAATNRPLAGVAVRNPAVTGQGASTDAQGGFTLPAAPTVLDLSLLGYAPLHVTLPAPHAGADTLRLLPTSYVLSDVSVRPPKAQVFSSVPADGPDMGRRLYPGQSIALLINRPAGAAADQPCVVNDVELFLREKVRQGRLRVRLVGIEATGSEAHPGANDLLPTPLVLSTAQLASAPKGRLVLDLTPYNLLVPAQGLCVVVDCLPTDPADLVSQVLNDGKGHTTVRLAPTADAPGHTFAGDDFPMLDGKRGVGTRTWSRFPGRPDWTTRGAVFNTVRADVHVLGY